MLTSHRRSLPLHGFPRDGRWVAPRAWSTASPTPATLVTRSGWHRPISGWSTKRSRTLAPNSASSISACARCCRCGSRRISRLGSANCGRSTALEGCDGPLHPAGEERLYWPRRRRKEKADGAQLRRVSPRRGCHRRRRDGRRADLGESQRQGLRHHRKAAWLWRAASRCQWQGSPYLHRRTRRLCRAWPP